MEIFEARVFPSSFLTSEEENRTLGYFGTWREANQAAAIWVRDSRSPHYGNECTCFWLVEIVGHTLGEVRPAWLPKGE